MTHSLAWDQVTHADVVRAIHEYDRLGPERFFSQHGFAPTTTYELVWDKRDDALDLTAVGKGAFIVGFSSHTTALVFYLIVGAGGLLATLLTRFEPRVRAEPAMIMRQAA